MFCGVLHFLSVFALHVSATSTHSFLQNILLIFVNLTMHIPVYVYLFKATCSKLAIWKYGNFTFVLTYSVIQLTN